MVFDGLKTINTLQADKELAVTRHQEDIAHIDHVSDVVLSATSSLIQYLEGHTTKTEVVNQLESIHTPDVQYVVEALQVLDATLKTHENTDLSEITGVMRELLNEAKSIPKTLPELPTPDKPIDYSNQLSALKDAIVGVEKVVKAQKLVAEAPVVNVPETNVHVDAPDLQPLQQGFKDVVKAVSDIVIPEYKTDNTAVEKLLKDANSLLERILKKPVSGGGGGGGSSWSAIGTNGLPAPLKVDGSGNLKTTEVTMTNRYDLVSPVYYVGSAPVGTADAVTGWIIIKYDLTTNPYTGKTATDVSWDNRATGTYA